MRHSCSIIFPGLVFRPTGLVRGCSTNTVDTHSFIIYLSHSFPKFVFTTRMSRLTMVSPMPLNKWWSYHQVLQELYSTSPCTTNFRASASTPAKKYDGHIKWSWTKTDTKEFIYFITWGNYPVPWIGYPRKCALSPGDLRYIRDGASGPHLLATTCPNPSCFSLCLCYITPSWQHDSALCFRTHCVKVVVPQAFTRRLLLEFKF